MTSKSSLQLKHPKKNPIVLARCDDWHYSGPASLPAYGFFENLASNTALSEGLIHRPSAA
jgi:hypothetical protein